MCCIVMQEFVVKVDVGVGGMGGCGRACGGSGCENVKKEVCVISSKWWRWDVLNGWESVSTARLGVSDWKAARSKRRGRWNEDELRGVVRSYCTQLLM